MLKYLEKELNRTNEDIKYLSLEKEELENNIVEFEQIIDSIEQYIQLKKMNKMPIVIASLGTAFIVLTVPLIFLTFYMLPAVLICDITVGVIDINNFIMIIENKIKRGKIKRLLGNRDVTEEEKYSAQRDLDDSDMQLSGLSTILLMKERDADVLETIIQSNDWLEELKKYPHLIKSALNYEFGEYKREVESIPVQDIHLNSLGKIRKLERK